MKHLENADKQKKEKREKIPKSQLPECNCHDHVWSDFYDLFWGLIFYVKMQSGGANSTSVCLVFWTFHHHLVLCVFSICFLR